MVAITAVLTHLESHVDHSVLSPGTWHATGILAGEGCIGKGPADRHHTLVACAALIMAL